MSCCLPSAEFRVASASNCAASLARVLFAMSLRSPSGSRTRHIPGHSGSGSTAESKRRPARRRSRSPCHIRQSLVYDSPASPESSRWGVFFTEGYASSPLRVRRTKTPDNDGLSCVPSPSNRSRMQSTPPREARAAASDHARPLSASRQRCTSRPAQASVRKSINQDWLLGLYQHCNSLALQYWHFLRSRNQILAWTR